jgi:hypothetical protein
MSVDNSLFVCVHFKFNAITDDSFKSYVGMEWRLKFSAQDGFNRSASVLQENLSAGQLNMLRYVCRQTTYHGLTMNSCVEAFTRDIPLQW